MVSQKFENFNRIIFEAVESESVWMDEARLSDRLRRRNILNVAKKTQEKNKEFIGSREYSAILFIW